MKITRWSLSIFGLALLLSIAGAASLEASNEIAKKEGLVCTACHDKPGSKLLTSRGKYYELTRSLEGYEEVMTTFGSCTTCHVRKPGSAKLTSKGREFQWYMEDMEGLKQWLMEQHPRAPEEPDAEAPETTSEPEQEADG